MAKLGEGDERWIVKEREDGRNCNNWHWTSKDVSANTKADLIRTLTECTFDAPLALAKIKSAEVTGEASVNNRKGKIFLIYDFEVKLKWEACDGVNENESCKGSMTFSDVNATMLDDLDCEFKCKAAGALASAMRKQGVATVKSCIEACMLRLQEEVRAEKLRADSEPVPESGRANATPAVAVPLPKPIAVATAPPKPAAAPQAKASVSADSSDEESPGDDAGSPPPALSDVLRRLRDQPEQTKEVCLANCSLRDAHLQPLIEALYHSSCAVEVVDLSFNRLTDSGVHVLCKAFSGSCALELSRLYLGGNKLSPAGLALAQQLKQMRADLLVDFKPQLRDARSMCQVGTVYPGSPAADAGLRSGDSVVAVGQLMHGAYKGVSESIVPIVKASVGKPIDMVVVRLDQAAQVHQVQITLTPKSWSGGGLLGCILK